MEKNKIIKTYCSTCPYFTDVIDKGEPWYKAMCKKDGHSTIPSMYTMYAIKLLNDDCPLTESKK